MARNQSYEKRIRVKVILMLLIMSLFYLAIFLYIYSLRTNINRQKEEIQQHEYVLLSTNEMMSSVQDIQNLSTKYLFSRHKSDYNIYDKSIKRFNETIQELSDLSPNNKQTLMLNNIKGLLDMKKGIIRELSRHFQEPDSVEILSRRIDSIHVGAQDTLLVDHKRDSIIVKEQVSKSFWDRLFHPNTSKDTIVETIINTDTTYTYTIDTVRLFNEIKATTAAVSANYQSNVNTIQEKVKQMMIADQNIFAEIYSILSKFHEGTVQAVLKTANENDRLTSNIFLMYMVSGFLSLTMIILIILFIIEDLNKGQKARMALAREKEITEQLTESRHRLLLSLSHNIKTPLSSMMGYMELWNLDETNPEKKVQLYSAINSGKHILSMLTNLLEFSRIEKGAITPKLSEFDLVELFDDITEMFIPLADKKDLSLVIDNQIERPFYVKSDYMAIHQTIINLLSNAVKYTISGEVKLSAEIKRNNVILKITDTGVGFDKTNQESVFRPFSRMDNPLTVEGSGLGLYITKGLVELLQGSISIDSEAGKGTSVLVILPLDRITPTVQISPADHNEHRLKRIIIFEDDIVLGKMLVEIIERMGHKVALRSDLDAIADVDFHTSNYDIVLTDMEIHHFTGIDVLKEIRAKDSVIPVWLITAKADLTDEDAKDKGFNGLIKKPVTISSLQAVLSGINYAQTKKETNQEFPMLAEMFEDDEESIRGILEQFLDNSTKDKEKLQNAIDTDNFAEAQRICHKIVPFMLQIKSTRLDISVLEKMNRHKITDQEHYPCWKEDLSAYLSQLEIFKDWLKNDYFTK